MINENKDTEHPENKERLSGLIIAKAYFIELGIDVEDHFSSFIKNNYEYAYDFQFKNFEEATSFALELIKFSQNINMVALTQIFNSIVAYKDKFNK